MPPFKPSISGCYVCSSDSNLFTCECKAIQYCGTEHEALDKGRHYKECAKITDAFDRTIPLFMLVCEVSISRFGLELPSDVEMRIRSFYDPHSLRFQHLHMTYELGTAFIYKAVIKILCDMNTTLSLKLASEKVVAFERIAGRDQTFFACTAVTLLRLGQEQLVYDYSRVDRDGRARAGRARYPHIDNDCLPFHPGILEERKPTFDVWEGMERVIRAQPQSHRMMVSILLLHCWILDLEDLELFRKSEGILTARLNYDVVAVIREHILQSEILHCRKDLVRATDNRAFIEELKGHRLYFLKVSWYEYRDFWQCLLDVDARANVEAADAPKTGFVKASMKHLKAGLLGRSKQKNQKLTDEDLELYCAERLTRAYHWEEAFEALSAFYPLWRDCPGAIDFVREFRDDHAGMLKMKTPAQVTQYAENILAANFEREKAFGRTVPTA
ncbi:hypothetical protein ABW21_db0209317 [Orbilia brochopaga]|nr:hypothetical protein ABW21_db0209317 [Drechslerella brochopaga]